jgi:hypothetical protein
VRVEAGERGGVVGLEIGSGLADRVGRDLREASATVVRWRREAREADRFFSGRQWHPADEARLNEEDRPTAVFNFAQKYIRIVAGTEKHNRQDVVFVPRMPETELANAAGELASAVYSSVIDGCNGPEERSQAFEDMLVRGMGWTNCRLDMELAADGKIVMERVDGMKMHWDPAARKQNLEDARWVACEEEIPMRDACRRWPEREHDLRVAEFLRQDRPQDEPDQVEHVTPIGYQPENETIIPGGPPAGYVRIVEYQYYEVEPVYRVADLKTNQVRELEQRQFDNLRRRLEPLGVTLVDHEMPSRPHPHNRHHGGSEGTAGEQSMPVQATAPESFVIPYVRQDRRVYKRCFTAGPVELECASLPVQGVGFTYKTMTGGFDAHDKVWRGLLQVLMDPQRFANKFFSQTLHIINSNAKGGLLAEATAFADPVKVEQDWANPSALILLEDGALSGDKPRIQERSRPSLPEGTFVMLKWCIDALGGVSGINPELLGSTTGDVPGVAQRQRQIQGMTINAGYFSALTRYLREEARLVFEFIRNFVADGRLIRLGGPFNARAIPLLREHLPVDYDLVIDEPAKSPNAKEVFWEKMAPIIPMLIKANAFLPEILDYSPFPASIAAKLKQQLASRTAMPAPGPSPNPGKDPREVQASVAQKSAAAELALARARDIDSQSRMRKLALALAAVRAGARADLPQPPA